MWRNNRDLFTYDWINIETFCVSVFGIWFAYGVLAWWLGGKSLNWFVKFILLTVAVWPMAAIGAFDLLQMLWVYGATIIFGRGIAACVAEYQADQKLIDGTSPLRRASRAQWSIKNLLLTVAALAVLLIVITKNKEDNDLFPTTYAIGFGILAGCVLLLSTAIGRRAKFAWFVLAFIATAMGQCLAFFLIFQEPTFSNLISAIAGTSFIWGEVEDFAIGVLLTIAFSFSLFGFCSRWLVYELQPTPPLGRLFQIVIGVVVFLQIGLVGDLFRKLSVTYPVRLNRLQTQADLALEQAVLLEKSELDFSRHFYPPDETDLMVSYIEKPLKRVKEILQDARNFDPEVTFVEQPLLNIWDSSRQISQFRTTARAFNFRSKWYESQGSYDSALNDGMQTMKLPRVFVDGRLLVNRLVAIAIEGMGAYRVAPIVGKASNMAISQALDELLELEEAEVDAVVDYRNDAALFWHSLNWLGRLGVLCAEVENQNNFQNNTLQAVYRCQATRRQLIVVMALELHNRKYHELPDRLEALTPEFLSEVPLDPFSEHGQSGSLRYRRDGGSYLLYSLGAGGDDNGGLNGESYGAPNPGVDLNFPAAIRQNLLEEQNDREQARRELEDAQDSGKGEAGLSEE